MGGGGKTRGALHPPFIALPWRIVYRAISILAIFLE